MQKGIFVKSIARNYLWVYNAEFDSGLSTSSGTIYSLKDFCTKQVARWVSNSRGMVKLNIIVVQDCLYEASWQASLIYCLIFSKDFASSRCRARFSQCSWGRWWGRTATACPCSPSCSPPSCTHHHYHYFELDFNLYLPFLFSCSPPSSTHQYLDLNLSLPL